MIEIARISLPDPKDFVARYVDPAIPVIIKDGMRDWPALTQWNERHLVTHCGTQRVPVEYYPDGDRCGRWTSLWMPLADYFEHLNAGNHRNYYLAETPISQVLPDLLDEIRPLMLADRTRIKKEVVFIGRDCYSAMHYHCGTQAILAQIVGDKRLSLYPPRATPHLYPKPWYSLSHNFSRVPFDQPVAAFRDSYPRAAALPPITCTLSPGDMLFIPHQWWHDASGDGLSISVTTFWSARWRHWRFPSPGLRDVGFLPARRALIALDSACCRLGCQNGLYRLGDRLGLIDRSRRYVQPGQL